MVEWFERKIVCLDEISDEEVKKEILAEFRIKLQSLTSLELENVACNLDFGRLFSQLTSNERSYIEEVCRSLLILINTLEPGEIHKRYPMEMNQYVSHSESPVKTLVLKELARTAASPEKVSQLIKDTTLMNLVVERIGDDDLSVADIAMDVVKKVGKVPEGAKALYSSTALRTFARLISKGSIMSFRVYEVVVDISKSSREGLQASAISGFLNSLINILEDDDVLLQLNTLELMADLASTDDGLSYLEERDVLKKMAEKIERAQDDPLSNLLIPGLMKFFGKVSRTRPNEIFSKYPVVISALFQVIEGDDPLLLANALDTLGHVASTVEGKYALQSLGEAMPNAIRRISQIIDKMPSELRVRGLQNLALIIHVDKNLQDNRITSLTKSWFDLIDTNPLDTIVRLCRQPFLDIKTAALEVLAEIASQTWGQEYIAASPGLTEFLLDRNIEAFKETKEIKYAVVKGLSQATDDIFDSGTLQKFTTFVRQGPFFIDLETEVATEGGL